MRPGSIMWALSLFQMMRAVWIIRKYSDDCDLDEAFTRMNLLDFWNLRSRMMCALTMMMTAQIMWWLP